jgi:hypothetical protein
MANAYAENFIGPLKHECLNHFVRFSQQQLDRITSLFLRIANGSPLLPSHNPPRITPTTTDYLTRFTIQSILKHKCLCL